MSLQLPAELTDRIIDYLHADTRSLTVCALVGPSWLPAARYHLFHSIEIFYNEASTFDEFVFVSPSFGQAIYSLELSNIDWRSNSWLYQPTGFLARLPAVQELTLTQFSVKGSIYAALCAGLPGVRRLTLMGCGFECYEHFLALMRSFPLLSSLSCGELFMPRPSDELSDELMPVLEELEMASTEWNPELLEPFLSFFIKSPASNALKKLTFSILSPYHAIQLAGVLDAVGPNLQELVLCVDSVNSPERALSQSALTLGHLTSVRKFKFVYFIREMCVPSNTALRVVPQLFAQLSSPVLHTIELALSVDPMDDLRALDSECGVRLLARATFDELRALDWEGIGAALGRDECSGLKVVEVVGQGRCEKLQKETKKRCPELWTRNILEFTKKGEV